MYKVKGYTLPFDSSDNTVFLTGKKKGVTTTQKESEAKGYATSGAAKMAAGWANNNASLVNSASGFKVTP